MLVGLVAIPGAFAFTSLPPGTSPHDEITRAAADEADYPDGGHDALLEAVRAPDLREMDWEPSSDNFVAVGLQDAYRAEHHCDRLLPADDAASFSATVTYITKERQGAVDEIAMGNASKAVQALGRALHAVQDCFSHTNAAEQGPNQLRALEAALLDGGPMPQGLRLGAVSEHAESPGAPDDPYAHDAHAKDSPHYNEVAENETFAAGSHYDQARIAATDASVRLLTAFLAGLNDDQRQQIAALDASDQSEYLKALNAPTVLLIIAAAVGIAALGYGGYKWYQVQ